MLYKHLNYSNRFDIETALSLRKSIKEIAEYLVKDPTSISREIKRHLIYVENHGLKNKNDCQLRFLCKKTNICNSNCVYKQGKCRFCGNCNKTSCCSDYLKEICIKWDKFPFACIGCKDIISCTLEHRYYKAVTAQDSYKTLLNETRSGFNLSEEELQNYDHIISDGIVKGQSIHVICVNHKDEIMVDEKTIYNLIDANVLKARNIDLPRKCGLKPRKTKKQLKIDKKCRINRTYDDFIKYIEETDEAVVEIDSVIGVQGGKAILTILFRQSGLQLYYLRDTNDSQSVINIFNDLYEKLGAETFKRIFPVILTDNGSEFSNPLALEMDNSNLERTKVYYCNPSASYQKGICERNHQFFRKFYPQGISFNELTQEKLNEISSNINGYGRKKLNDQSPFDAFSLLYGSAILEELGLFYIKPNDIVLKKYLLK